MNAAEKKRLRDKEYYEKNKDMMIARSAFCRRQRREREKIKPQIPPVQPPSPQQYVIYYQGVPINVTL